MFIPAPKTAVVTGATGGIGRWIALGLVGAGYRVMLVGRDAGRASAAQAWIAQRVPSAATMVRIADLSSLDETSALAEGILRDLPKLDLLVNNAGGLFARREVTAEGHEKTLATNHLSPCLLTTTLLPALRVAGRARIVTVGSSSSDRARIDPGDLELTRGWGMVRAYGQSKLAVMMASFALARRLDGTGITVNVVHPGLVATGLVKHGGMVGIAWRIMAPFSLTAEQGAATPLFACLAPQLEGQTGLYLKRRRPAKPNARALDPVLAARVEKATEELLMPRGII
jgi:NAD(P)-dependent dehydrogenase (short-subunit alcohol dehydrogenase family)